MNEEKITNEKPQITLKVELKPYLQVYGDGSGGRSSCKRWVAERRPVNGDVFECCGCVFKIAMGSVGSGCGGERSRYINYSVEGYIISADGITLPEAKAGMDFIINLNVLATPDKGLKVVDRTVFDVYDADEQKECAEELEDKSNG